MGYPFFVEILKEFRPGVELSLEDYVYDCYHIGFVEMCHRRFDFSPEEFHSEHERWKHYIHTHLPDTYPGIREIIIRQKELGGLVCVVSHSYHDVILRDYKAHFGIVPDAIYSFELPPEHRKPNSYPLLDIMNKFQLRPEDILVVDDAKLACQMADPLGIPVAFPGWSKLAFDTITREMTELCHYAFRTPKELEQFLFSAD
jgi:phosphoglycolate phosphatase/pyrophosphatase PpaX